MQPMITARVVQPMIIVHLRAPQTIAAHSISLPALAPDGTPLRPRPARLRLRGSGGGFRGHRLAHQVLDDHATGCASIPRIPRRVDTHSRRGVEQPRVDDDTGVALVLDNVVLEPRDAADSSGGDRGSGGAAARSRVL